MEDLKKQVINKFLKNRCTKQAYAQGSATPSLCPSDTLTSHGTTAARQELLIAVSVISGLS